MDYLTLVGAAFIVWFLLVVLFTPHINYHIEGPVDPRSTSFVCTLESTCQTTLERDNRIDILTNGSAFYPAMLEEIRGARETINFECYIFEDGEIGGQFVEALSERARAGIRVTIVWDALGSFSALRGGATVLREAGCRLEPYQGVRWYNLARLNNRTHRELLVVDGHVAFVGGAGVADWWWTQVDGKPPWRDMMARIEGPVVSDIQGIIAENWLECSGEVLTGPESYKPSHPAGSSPAFAIRSSPADRATTSRVLYQTLVECAARRVRISTPYFLPDKAFRRALARTTARGVEIVAIVPGSHTDQKWVRLASRRMYGQILGCGVRVFEYEAGMTHVKTLVVDDLWAVIGTTNLDNRSFEHNDEVNLAVRDEAVAARLTEDFTADLAGCREVTLADWKRRPWWEKVIGPGAWILERQQ